MTAVVKILCKQFLSKTVMGVRKSKQTAKITDQEH